MTSVLTNGSFSSTCSGVSSSHSSSPQESAEDMRRFSSSIRCFVRATSTPPLIVARPSSMYWRAPSFLTPRLSFQWGAGEEKFDACPPQPPRVGGGAPSCSPRPVPPHPGGGVALLLSDKPTPLH